MPGALSTPVDVSDFTQRRFDQMLADAKRMLTEIGVPISSSVCPNIVFIRTFSWYGQCCGKKSKYAHPDYDFVIRISYYTIRNSEKSLMNTILHELIHTVSGTNGHDSEWKKWAELAGTRLGYHITRCNGDKTIADRESLNSHIKRTVLSEWIVECDSCSYHFVRKKRTKVIRNIRNYLCPFCKTKTLYAWKSA